jgi:FKBP-type peptidyl-prolyl cis-trans isomerase FklB
VKVTESGLQYEILEEGEGPIPSAGDKVNVHYHGTLINGEVFDSSVDRGKPISFPVTGVIQGWQEALQMMPVGSKWKLYIPYDLGYGSKGAGASIKPYSTLIFEVELLEIE